MSAAAKSTMQGKTIRVFFDDRETRCGVPEILLHRGVDAVQQRLAVGDYDLGAGVLVERKHAPDFLASMEDGRLREQLDLLAETAILPILIVEGDVFSPRAPLSWEARRSMISWIVQFRQIWVVHSRDTRDSAQWLETIARHVQHGAAPPPVHAGKGLQTGASRQLTMLRVLPGVGEQRAQSLLLRFGSALAAMNASVAALEAVVGRATARGIRTFLDSSGSPTAENIVPGPAGGPRGLP
jgi:ERCC4-type nuclease